MKRRKHHMKRIEFSKLVLGMVMATYFFGVLIGAYVVLRSNIDKGTLLSALLTFIGAPTATALGWYYWKAKNENMQKNTQPMLETPDIQMGTEEDRSL